ncbi:hydrolase [Sphingomonas japonica]|uniref:FMN phosphatase YigB (HAD superfamily) n=1 Tax=Sphingomonas japonica TaxID=511662 RepID=A0ABX0U022_9SPHN|nr:hydrolase [Sphingomonas japonica]NIJ23859.1 FMN phosphatase YigB (HAD superfamily) [Sphingomonas japonica]
MTKLTIRAHAIASLLDQLPPGVTTLSLDCFDTLLWRDVAAPRDVFAGIDLPGGAVEPRMWAERTARRRQRNRGKGIEIDLATIHRTFDPTANAEQQARAVAHECALEARHCFGFAPTIALMRAAKERGLGIVIVSDTYLSEAQLRMLIEQAAGADVLALIDRVFVSSQYRVGKTAGLFAQVLSALGIDPQALFHVGDNPAADRDAPSRLGIGCAHLIQFDRASEQRLRLEAGAAAMIDPAVRMTTPAWQRHRAAVALRSDDSPAAMLGHDVLGPLLHEFSQWLHDEIAALSDALGKPVRPLFLMRDGYLPLEMFRAAFGADGPAAAVEISRITATRASFVDAASVEVHVIDTLDRVSTATLADQLMLTAAERRQAQAGGTRGAFRRAVLERKQVARIVARSRQFADRLIAHLAAAGVENGDAVMLVDLGYNGTVQNLVAPMLADRMKLTVVGRYLMLREGVASGLDKAGFLDRRHYEARVLNALSGSIAVLEQLCTVAQGSTTDYRSDGSPIRAASGIKGAQSTVRDAVQAAAIAYVANAARGVVKANAVQDRDADRRSAAAVLARLMFLPIAREVELLEAFDHDVNLGSDDVVRLLDGSASTTGLRRRGPAYLNTTDRMFVPGELQRHGLALNLALFGSARHALDLRNADFEGAGVPVPVMLLGSSGQQKLDIDARPTADGFYRMVVPIGTGTLTPAVQLGALCEWVQLGDAQFVALADLDRTEGDEIRAEIIADGMTAENGGLYRAGPAGFVLAPPKPSDRPMALILVFRPVVWRSDSVAAAAAA